jgi:hypothetical protein
MRFEYVCRHCKQSVGRVEHRAWSYSDGARQLGLHHLDVDHQQEAIHSTAPDIVQVDTICEHCEEAVRMNPQLLVEGSVIQ